MLSIRVLVRLDLHKPMFPPNVKEEARGIIYRRSIAIATHGKFSTQCEYDALPPDLKESGYIPHKGDTLKMFLESRPAASAFFNIIYR